MAATTGAVLNGLNSPFLCGGKRSQALLSAGFGTTRVGGGPAAPERFIVVAAAAPKKSWIPAIKASNNFIDPEWLASGRWAMAAVVSIFVGQAWSGAPKRRVGSQRLREIPLESVVKNSISSPDDSLPMKTIAGC